MTRFLRDYGASELEANARLVEESIGRLPFTLSAPVKALAAQVDKGDFSLGMNYALDFLEISIQFVSCYLFTRLQEKEDGMEAGQRPMKAIVEKIDTKRSLSFGDWVNDIFNPIVKAAAKELPDEPLVQSIRAELFSRSANRLLGSKTEPSVVRIRNEYKGHSTTLSNDIYKGVVYTLEPQILAVLRALRPMQDFSFSYEGSHCIVSTGQKDEAPADLFPLVFRSDKGYEYVFQSLKDEEISYISSDLDAVTFINDSLNADFDRLLQRTLPSFDISKEMNWTEILALMRAESGRFLDRVYREKKYNRELFVERSSLSEVLDEFTRSPKTLFPLLGEAGQGKTNQLCWWTEEFSKSEDAVLIFSSADFAGESLDNAIRRIFQSSPRKDPVRILREVHVRAEQEDRLVYIFFDAVNECLRYDGKGDIPGPVALYEAFRGLFTREEFPRFKLLFTCRSYSWKNLFRTQMTRDADLMFSQDVEVHGFSDGELRKAWGIYQNLYQMEGGFDELSRVSLVRLKDPLVLKIACTNHVGTALPGELERYSSIALFSEMVDNISRSYAGRRQYEIMMSMAEYIMGEYQKGRPSDRIDGDELKKALHDPQAPLHRLSGMIYRQEGLSVAYTELLNKPERPILRYIRTPDGRAEIQFIYERFLEYLMARVFVEQNAVEGRAIPASVILEAISSGSGSVVYVGAMRNALLMDWMRSGDDTTIVSLARDHEGDFEASLLTNEVLNVLIRENYESMLFSLMNRMLDFQAEGSGEVIREFNEITKQIQGNKATGEIIARHKQLRAVLAPAIRLGNTASLSIVNGMFLSDWFSSGLYRQNPYTLLWRLVCNPLLDVSNDACMYIYYLHNKKYTLDFTPLQEDISARIVREMFSTVRSRGCCARFPTPPCAPAPSHS